MILMTVKWCVFLCWLITTINGLGISRLPDTISPFHYRLSLLPVLEKDPRLCGYALIDIVAHQPTNTITLNAVELVIHRIVVHPLSNSQFIYQTIHREEKGDKLTEELCFTSNLMYDNEKPPEYEPGDIFDSFELDEEKEFLIVRLKKELEVGEKYQIGILYMAEVMNRDDHGFFRMSYIPIEEECCVRWIGATQLEAAHARRVFPSFDEPSFKSSFQLRVGRPPAAKSISNMPLDRSEAMKFLEWIWDVFKETPKMSTYLVAVVVTELEYKETSYMSIDGRNISIRLWTHQHQFDQLNFGIDLVPKTLIEFENYLQVPFSLPQLDIIAVPGYDSARAMENWGLIVHSESNLLLPDDASSFEKVLVAVTIVHEISHQLTPELNPDSMLILFFQQSLYNDKLGIAPPLNNPVELLPTIEDKFDGFAYTKASALFRMVKNFIGDEAFQKALQRYMNKYKFKNANSTDLWNLMNQEARRMQTIGGRMNIARIVKTWTSQSGYPLVQVNCENGIVYLNQTPFIEPDFPPLDNETAIEQIAWWIPVTMANTDSLRFYQRSKMPEIFWLTPKKPTLEIEDSKCNTHFVIVNIECSGYYRVNYNQNNWELIAKQLLLNHSAIPILTRSQLIDDAFTLAHAKFISYEIPLRLSGYLKNSDEDVSVRKIATDHVARIQIMMMEDKNIVNKTGLQKMVNKMIEHVTGGGFREEQERARLHELRTGNELDSIDCLHQKNCIEESIRFFHTFMKYSITSDQNKNTRVNNDKIDSVLCMAIQNGDETEWNLAWKTSTQITSRHQLFRRKLLKAMSCTAEPFRIKQLLSRAFHPDIKQKPKETMIILRSLADNALARRLTVNYIFRNWTLLKKHIGNPSESMNLLDIVAMNKNAFQDSGKVNTFLFEQSEKLKLTPGGNEVNKNKIIDKHNFKKARYLEL